MNSVNDFVYWLSESILSCSKGILVMLVDKNFLTRDLQAWCDKPSAEFSCSVDSLLHLSSKVYVRFVTELVSGVSIDRLRSDSKVIDYTLKSFATSSPSISFTVYI